jgi:HAMP domain-containing protein
MDHLTVSPTQLAVAAGLLIVLVVLVLLIVLIVRGRRRRRRKRAEAAVAASDPSTSPPTEPTPTASSMPSMPSSVPLMPARPGPAPVDRAPYWSSGPRQPRAALQPTFDPTEPDRTVEPAAAEPVDQNPGSAAPGALPERNGMASAANPPADQDHRHQTGYQAAAPSAAAPSAAAPSAGTPPMDAKDRLLRVLLADPARALHAVGDLEASRGQLDRLNESVRYQRRQLADAARRLRGAGLTPAQVAQLAGFGEGELVTLLAEHAPSPTPRRATRDPESH